MKIRVGLGYDIHRLAEGRPLYLGGVKIPFQKGLLGHSDGDSLIHAIADALLGTLGDTDLGQLFPDSAPEYKDSRSTKLLEKVMARLEEKGVEVVNIDSVIVAQEPRLAEFIPLMKEALCPILRIKKEKLGIKPRTNENLGEIGRGEAIAAWSVVLVRSKE
ncbi:MAG: 2-C-methyl-D-erythritol 2,4-cyclodiphosphate synthase [Candidatus Aminicenantes bacterium]